MTDKKDKDKKYIALTGLNDADENRWEIGDVVTAQDFSKKVINHWLNVRNPPALREMTEEEYANAG